MQARPFSRARTYAGNPSFARTPRPEYAGRVKALIALALCLAVAPLAAQEIYRWVDENGVVHYSDQPREGAERVQVRAPMTFESQMRMDPAARDPAAAADEAPALRYTSIRITSPPDGEPIWATGGIYTVQVETVPALQPGHRVALQLNGIPVPGTPVANTRIELTGLIRGEHHLQAAVVDPSDQWLIFSDEITFHVLQASIHNPRR
jgi:hypothetical protein